jgi:hypothetical protein
MTTVKVSKNFLKDIIKEELKSALDEQLNFSPELYGFSSTVLHLFDFDDTLAKTDNVVQVTSVDPETGEPTGTESMDSESFEKYRQKPFSERSKDLVNFDSFNSVLNPVEIKSLVDLIKKANEEPSGIVAIITARAGEQNKKDISSFLESKGLKNIPVHTVGDSGGRPEDKLKVVRKYVEDYTPKELFFYDDSRRNLRAILTLCSSEFPGLKVNTFDIVNGEPVPAEECQSTSDITI